MITVGIDEVGRGCWAGPLVAGAVIMGTPLNGIKDSKKLGKKRRQDLAQLIDQQAVAVGLGWVTAKEVDALGLTAAVRLAMERAMAQIDHDYDEIIIDGDFNFFADNPKAKAVIKADDSVPSVSAASIVAKVARDKYMASLNDSYGFAQHVGYGTALHLKQLKLHGVSEEHRKSFRPIKALL